MRPSSLAVVGTLLLLISQACGGGGASSTPLTGAGLFENQCAMCHMRDGSGSNLAPTLQGKRQHWTRETLAKYLVDPQGYAAKDARLHAQGAKYSQAMPTYKMLSAEQIGLLADHVLAMP